MGDPEIIDAEFRVVSGPRGDPWAPLKHRLAGIGRDVLRFVVLVAMVALIRLVVMPLFGLHFPGDRH